MESHKIIQSGLLEQYVLGLTSSEENVSIESYMATYPEVREKVERLRSCMDHYTGIYNIPCPSQFRKQKKEANTKKSEHCLFVESKFGQSRHQNHAVAEANRLSFANLASFMLLIFASSSVYFYNTNTSDNELSELQNKVHHLESQYNTASTKINSLEVHNQLLKDLHTRKVLMSNENASEAKAVVYYNDVQEKMLLDPLALPTTNQDQCYHIWAELGNRKKIFMGQINPTTAGHKAGLMPLNFIKDVSQLIITKESNGKEQPLLQTSFH